MARSRSPKEQKNGSGASQAAECSGMSLEAGTVLGGVRRGCSASLVVDWLFQGGLFLAGLGIVCFI